MALSHDISAVPACSQLILDIRFVDTHDRTGHDIVLVLFFDQRQEDIVDLQTVRLDHRIIIHQKHMADILCTLHLHRFDDPAGETAYTAHIPVRIDLDIGTLADDLLLIQRFGIIGDQHIKMAVQRRIRIFQNGLFQHIHIPFHILFPFEGTDIHRNVYVHIHRYTDFFKIFSLPEAGTVCIGFQTEGINAFVLSVTEIKRKDLRLCTEDRLLFQDLGFHLTFV